MTTTQKHRQASKSTPVRVADSSRAGYYFRIESEKADRSYEVHYVKWEKGDKKGRWAWGCNCPDMRHNGVEECKHVLRCLQEIKARQQPAAADEQASIIAEATAVAAAAEQQHIEYCEPSQQTDEFAFLEFSSNANARQLDQERIEALQNAQQQQEGMLEAQAMINENTMSDIGKIVELVNAQTKQITELASQLTDERAERELLAAQLDREQQRRASDTEAIQQFAIQFAALRTELAELKARPEVRIDAQNVQVEGGTQPARRASSNPRAEKPAEPAMKIEKRTEREYLVDGVRVAVIHNDASGGCQQCEKEHCTHSKALNAYLKQQQEPVQAPLHSNKPFSIER